MIIFSKKNKEKQLYSSKILYKAPNIYETYKRMIKNKNINLSELNTSRTSIDGLSNNINNNMTARNNEYKYNLFNRIDLKNKNIKSNEEMQKKIKKNKPHLSYLGFLESKGFSFHSNESRFKWQNTDNYNYPTGINTFQRTKKHVKINCDSNMEYKYKRQKKFIFSISNDNSFEHTQRVLNTYTNNINDRIDGDISLNKSKKKINFQKFVNVGGVAELLKKTPLKENIKGVKRIKRTKSYELNLFGNNYAKFEMPRKVKKHFIDKNIDNDIFGRKKHNSMDKTKSKGRKLFKKFKNYIDINPINWHLINYNNFYGKKN